MKARRLLVAALTLSCAACGGGGDSGGSAVDGGAAADSPIVLTVAHDAQGTHPYQPAMEKFKEVVERQTDGAVRVEIYPAGQLGNEEQEILGVRLGHIDATVVAAGNLVSLVPELDLFNLPFIFRDKEHFYRVIDGPIGEWAGRAIEQHADCVFLGFWPIGARQVWNSERAVQRPEDLGGLKVRVMASPILLETFDAFGAQATSMSLGEVYSALQMGVIDGAEGSATDMLVERFYEVAGHLTATNHVIGAAPVIFNRAKYEQLPPGVQVVILEASRAAGLVARQADATYDEDAMLRLAELGVQVQRIDRELFARVVAPIYERYAARFGGSALIERIRGS